MIRGFRVRLIVRCNVRICQMCPIRLNIVRRLGRKLIFVKGLPVIYMANNDKKITAVWRFFISVPRYICPYWRQPPIKGCRGIRMRLMLLVRVSWGRLHIRRTQQIQTMGLCERCRIPVWS